MKKTFDRKIFAGFVLALAIWLTIGSILYRNTSEQAQEARWLSHTYDALAKIQELLLRITEGETARRGFVMSGGRAQFLTQYSNAVERANTAFGELRALTGDNPRQQRTCNALQPLIQERLAVYSECIALQSKPESDASAQLRLTEKGQQIMEHIRRLIAEMDLAERGYLQRRRNASEANLRRTQQIALGGFFAGSLMLGWAFVLLVRENGRRRGSVQRSQSSPGTERATAHR
jgi:CHASE3 domain sensor protein